MAARDVHFKTEDSHVKVTRSVIYTHSNSKLEVSTIIHTNHRGLRSAPNDAILSMSRPPKTTVIFNSFPEGWVVGIDLQFFNTNSLLKGIKLIPEGIHVVHYAADQASIRTGVYFEAKEEEVKILQWDVGQERVLVGDEIGELNVSKELSKLPEYYSYMINYPEDLQWGDLTKFISFKQIQYILPKFLRMDSVLTSTDENNMLLEALQKSAQNRNISNDPIVNSIIDQSDEEINYTVIDLSKTIRPNSTPEETTRDSLDKSWFLQHLLSTGFNSSEELFLGEFQLAFINMIIFANYSSSIQWLKYLRVLLNCKSILPHKESLFLKFLNQLFLQFLKFPDEYMDQFIDERFIQISLGEFEYNVKELNLHTLVREVINLKNLLSSKFHIEIEGLLEDEEEPPVIVVD